MCQSKTQGGLRCAPVAKPRFDLAFKIISETPAPTQEQLTELQAAASAYASTPNGSAIVTQVAEQFWLTRPEIAGSLVVAAKIGVRNRQIAADVARLTKMDREEKGLPVEDAKPLECLPINPMSGKSPAPAPKFDADTWMAQWGPDKPMSELWQELLNYTNVEERHEARALIRSIDEEDLATYIVVREELDQGTSVGDISGRTGLPIEDVAKTIKRAGGRLMATRLGAGKLEILAKIKSESKREYVEPAWLLQATRDGVNLAAVHYKKKAAKMGRFEPVAAAFIRSRTGLTTLQLSRIGTNLGIRFRSDGDIKVSKGKAEGHSKSADLAVIVEDGSNVKVILAGHKFAEIEGGGQDNQWVDAAIYLNNALVAKSKGKDIPGLRELVSKSLGREIDPKDFSWEPALILDGSYYADAPTKMRLDTKRRLLKNTTAFLGDVDTFVAKFKKTTPAIEPSV